MSLVGWWKCLEQSGSVAADSSGFGRDATLQNTAAFGTGPAGSSLVLGGYPANDFAITAADGPTAIGSLTIAMWINRAALVRGGLLSKTNGLTWNYDFIIGFTANELSFYSDSIAPTTVMSVGQVSTTGDWHHVAVTVDTGGNVVSFYIDGVLAGAPAIGGLMASSAGEKVNLGSEGDPSAPTTDYFHGSMYDVRIYDNVLTPAEIAVLAEPPMIPQRMFFSR